MLEFLLLIALVLLNGFFVAAEFSIVKVRNTRIAQLSGEGNVKAKRTQVILEHLDAYLSATQLGITLSSLALGWVGEPFLSRLIEPLLQQWGLSETSLELLSFTIGFSTITFFHVVIGEMVPKSLAIRRAEQVALWTAHPLRWFAFFFQPVIWILNRSAHLFLQLIGMNDTTSDPKQVHSEEEIRMLVEESHQGGLIDQTELSLLDNIFDFTDRVGREIMVPRVDMICVYTHRPLDENIEIIKNSTFTRFPLCGVDKDDIVGIIHIRDLYERLIQGKPPLLSKLSRPAVHVPESMEIKDILRVLQKNKTELAIVVDEYGGTSGLITIEDIIEEIVGEIQDEFDDEQPDIIRKGGDTIIDAQILIEEVNAYFQILIEDLNNDTIGGWIFSQLQEIPQKGAQVTYGAYDFIVHKMEQRRIAQILVRRHSSVE